MDNKFKFKTRYVSIVQRSSSVVNSFTSSVELIQAMAYKLKRDMIQTFEKKYRTILKSVIHGITLLRAIHLITIIIAQNVMKKYIYIINRYQINVYT